MTNDKKGSKKPNSKKGNKRPYTKDSNQDQSLNEFKAPENTPATYSLITGETINTFSGDFMSNNVSYDTLLMQTIRLKPFGEAFDSTEPQALFSQEQFQSALNIATRRTVSYKINNSWSDHFKYFESVVYALEIYYSLDSIIRFTDNAASKNSTLTYYRNVVINAEVLDRHRVLGRILETTFLPSALHDYIVNIYKLRLSGSTGNSTIIGYTAIDYDRVVLPTEMVKVVDVAINLVTDLVTGSSNNNVATNLANLLTRSGLNWILKVKEMPAALGYDAEYMNLFMNSSKAYRPNTALLQNFPLSRYKLSYTEGNMNPSTVISIADRTKPGIIVPTVTSTNSLSYIKSSTLGTIVRIPQNGSDGQTAMFGTPGYYVSTTGSVVDNVQSLLPGGKLTFGTTDENRVSLINNLLYLMLDISALS